MPDSKMAATHRVLHLDSRYRDRGTIENAVYVLPRPISGVQWVQLQSAQMLNTFDNVTASNNVINIDGTSYTIPTGIYTFDTLMAALNTLLSGVVVFSADAAALRYDLDTSVNFDVDSSTCGSLLSLWEDDATLTQTGIINLANPTYVNIHSKIIARSGSHTTPTSGATCIVDSIPLTVPSGGLQTAGMNSEYSVHEMGNCVLNSIDVSLRDDAGSLLNANDVNYRLRLKVWGRF